MIKIELQRKRFRLNIKFNYAINISITIPPIPDPGRNLWGKIDATIMQVCDIIIITEIDRGPG
ncbi:MAG TPA: hypothetical protein DEO84_05300 [candidate division Zixibacteria bacterium]|nr:hypothetical protein [candidate division Zixibacteria bacterium]HBZ00723.1 hypothetical protein [candidate division Zixibacteria bacterium]